MKQTFKHSVRLLLYLLFVSLATFMITISFRVIFSESNWAFYAFSQLFSFLIMFMIVWQTVYIVGFRDSNMVRTGHMSEDIYRGFKIGAIAQSPWLVLLIVSLIFNMRFSIYRIINSTYWTFLTAFCGAFDSKKAVDLRMLDTGVLGIGGSVLLLLIVPALSGVVYILGYKGVDLFSKFVYKKRKEK